MTNAVGHLFMCSFPVDILISSLVQCLQIFYPLFYWLFSYFGVFKFLKIYFRHNSFLRYVNCKYFLPDCGLAFHSVNSVFHRTEI